MPLIVDIPPELETKITRAAERNGVSENDFVRSILEEKLRSHSESETNRQALPRLTAYGLAVKDRSREHDWLDANRALYEGKYVALDGNNLVACGESVKQVAAAAREKGINDALIVFVETRHTPPYVGGVE